MIKILVFGDSIGYGKRDHEGWWVARLRKRVDEKYNFWAVCHNAQVYNCCIPGETALRMQQRFEDELSMKSVDKNNEVRVIVVFAIGINDSCLKPWIQWSQAPIEQFEEAMETMLQHCSNNHFETLVVWLTPIDEMKVWSLFQNQTIQLYDEMVQNVAKRMKAQYIPLYDLFVQSWIAAWMTDGIHPDDTWHEMIFQEVRRGIDRW